MALRRLLDFFFLLVDFVLADELEELAEFEDDFAALGCWGRAAAIIEHVPASIAKTNNRAMDKVLNIPPALDLSCALDISSAIENKSLC